MPVTVKECTTYEAYITIGSVRGYLQSGSSKLPGIRRVARQELRNYIGSFQKAFENNNGYCCAVQILDGEVIFRDYAECCYNVCAINYPRYPLTPSQISDFMCDLTANLLEACDQERVTVVLPDRTVMFEKQK